MSLRKNLTLGYATIYMCCVYACISWSVGQCIGFNAYGIKHPERLYLLAVEV